MKTYKARSLIMKKMQNYIPWSVLVLGALTTQSGCVDAGETLRILRNQEPSGACEVSDSAGDAFLSSGIIDVQASAGYLFTPLVENRAVASGVNERLVFVDAAIVDLKFANGFYSDAEVSALDAAGLAKFRQPFSGSIPAGGVSSFAFEVIPKDMLDDMASKLAEGEITRVIADVEIRGTLDGADVASPTFTYPIEVCNGCLTQVIGTCDALPAGDVQIGGACQELQDGVLECCTGADGSLVCPAVATEPTQ